MAWWLLITALVVGALAFAYREHRRDGRRLTALFSTLAAKYGGEVRPGSWLVLPQLRFERDGGRYLVAAMASSGAHEGGSGSFTFVEVELPAERLQDVRVEGSDPAAASSLPAAVRAALPASPVSRLEAVGRKVRVEMRGIVRSAEDLEQLIHIAGLLARR
jgi:hypothetical protein